MLENCYYVYRHTTPSGKVYIGLTGGEPKKRWARGYKYNIHFQNAINKYGWENIKHEVVYAGLTEQCAGIAETRLIREHQSDNPAYGYNKTSGGEHNTPTKETNEQRSKTMKKKHEDPEFHQKTIDIMRDRDTSFTKSNEWIRKISASSKKNWETPETRAKIQTGIAKANLKPEVREKRKAHIKKMWDAPGIRERACQRSAYYWSDQSYREMQSARHKQHYQNNPDARLRLCKTVRCVETGETFASGKDAGVAVGLTAGSIYYSAKTGGTAKGCHWEYV